MTTQIERIELAPNYSISRILTGLWQIADMERENREFDQAAAVKAMQPRKTRTDRGPKKTEETAAAKQMRTVLRFCFSPTQ